MPQPLVECVPNYSEARRPEVVEAILASIRAVPGVRVLDRHSDLDHNRTVFTFVGSPVAVEEAAFQSIATAARLIDLDQHTGEHPRIGATDVVPFVPLAEVSMQDCVEIARRLGQRVGDELGIPVYLYEQAATRPERQNLENLRKGQYEGLKEDILTNPERAPDFGPARLGPAGATVIGARPFLIAYNVYLTTSEVAIAERIARAIRHSSGGLRYVKALGLLVDGRAQVSMNLTDFRKTPVARAVELIRREAARYGVEIHHSELVGLIPQDAIVEAARWYLQLDQFEPEQVLERRLYTALQESTSGGQGQDFLEALAAETPAPGGGSASAYAGAMSAGLVAMVARLTIGRKKYAGVETQMRIVLEEAEGLRAALAEAVSQDAAAYEAVMAAYKLPKDDPAEQQARSAAVQSAMLEAARVPLSVVQWCVQVLDLVNQVVVLGNVNAISDAGTAAALAGAALAGAALNVRINVAALEDREAAGQLADELQIQENSAAGLQEQIQKTIRERGGLASA
ncbi:MAG TPA: glutamate formimidoyltransferase [Anaerolineales bacterium]|nr:glutamate formimidoyltransferase [Anaerolineales bacterium]